MYPQITPFDLVIPVVRPIPVPIPRARLRLEIPTVPGETPIPATETALTGRSNFWVGFMSFVTVAGVLGAVTLALWPRR
jgi:hypothetical protein